MTCRAEQEPLSPVEKATAEVIAAINEAIRVSHIQQAVREKQHIGEKEFRRIIALYFTHLTVHEWCDRLGIPDASDPDDPENRRQQKP